LCSLEDIIETLKGFLIVGVEVENIPYGEGKIEGSRNSDQGPPLEEITKEL
jgi:hypothetical protein